jgi:hypothetical protein
VAVEKVLIEENRVPQALKRGHIVNNLVARVELVPLPTYPLVARVELVPILNAARIAYFNSHD